MKTLYVGVYDCGYDSRAYEFIDNEFILVNISEEDMYAIYDYNHRDNKIEWYDKLSNEVKQYDNIIMCADAYYSFIDLTKIKE